MLEINKVYNGLNQELTKQLNNNSINLIITSPPYFVDKEYEKDIYSKRVNLLDNYKRYSNDLVNYFIECERVLTNGANIYINIDDSHTSIKSELKKNIVLPTHAILINELSKVYDYKGMILWRKIRGKYASGGSNRLLGSFGRFGSPSSIPIVQEVEYILWFKKRGIRKVSDELRKNSSLTKEEFAKYGMQIWDISTEKDRTHCAPFPIEIPYRLIKIGCFINDVVLDPFAGSCTTAIACNQTKRNWIMFEKEKQYCEYAKRRLSQTSFI